MDFNAEVERIRSIITAYREKTVEMAKREQLEKDIVEYSQLHQQVLDEIQRLRQIYDPSDKEQQELLSWIQEEGQYVNVIHELNRNYRELYSDSQNITDMEKEEYITLVDSYDRYRELSRQAKKIERASLKIDKQNRLPAFNTQRKFKYIDPNLIDEYEQIIAAKKEVEKKSRQLYQKLMQMQPVMKTHVEEQAVAPAMEKTEEIVSDPVTKYRNNLKGIFKMEQLPGQGKKVLVTYLNENGEIEKHEIPKHMLGRYRQNLALLSSAEKRKSEVEEPVTSVALVPATEKAVLKQAPREIALVGTKDVVPSRQRIIAKKKLSQGRIQKFAKYFSRNAVAAAMLVLTTITTVAGFFGMGTTNKVKANMDDIPVPSPITSPVFDQQTLDKVMNVDGNKVEYDIPVQHEVVHVGDTVSITPGSTIYISTDDAKKEENKFKPYFPYEDERVVLGVTVDQNGKDQTVLANDSHANEKIDALLQSDGKIETVLVGDKTQVLPNYDGSYALTSDQINQDAEGWYHINSVVHDMERGLSK